MLRMQHDERLQAIGMLPTGRSQREVANTFIVSKSGTNKPKMLTSEPVQVVPGQRQEYRIDSSITRPYEISLEP